MSERQKAIRLLGITLAILVCAGLAAYLLTQQYGITEANGRRIVTGMTAAEVEAILGPANELAGRKRQEFWDAYRFLGCKYVAIAVDYDADGRVCQTRVSTSWGSPRLW